MQLVSTLPVSHVAAGGWKQKNNLLYQNMLSSNKFFLKSVNKEKNLSHGVAGEMLRARNIIVHIIMTAFKVMVTIQSGYVMKILTIHRMTEFDFPPHFCLTPVVRP